MYKTGIGGILTAGSIIAALYHFACIPVVFALWALMTGYLLRVMRQTVKGAKADQALPDWNEWGDLFLSGITWIAFQFVLWASTIALCALALSYCAMSAGSAGSDTETLIWSAAGTFLVTMTCANLAFISSYVMVHFAVEENSRAGVSYLKIIKRTSRHPLHYLTGFLLAIGLQWAAVLLPIVTVIGVFVIPSTWFIGQIISAVILARYWSADVTPDNDQKKIL